MNLSNVLINVMFYVIANLNLNPVVQIRLILLMLKYPDKLLMGHLDINSIRNIFDAFPANIGLDEDVLKTSFVFVFRRRLQDVFKTS